MDKYILALQPEIEAEVSSSCCGSATVASEIKRTIATELSYNDFYWHYMKPNRPVILTNVSSEWECRRNWIIPADNAATDNANRHSSYTAINFQYLRRVVGDCRVPVANCAAEYFNSHAKSEMSFYDYLDYWQAKVNAKANDTTATALEPNSNTTVDVNSPTSNLYLKDWHLRAQLPQYDFYQVPKHFAADWLNEQLLANGRDDYRFVYMGPAGTWTPFHADVFGSYSWSTNIAGCKKWILLPPGEELKLRDRLGNLPFSIDVAQLEAHHVHSFTLLQGENEAIFVPSGWYHQVWNLTDTISVNHNWFNACNVQRIWQNLSSSMQQVLAEIDDCRQMDNFVEHCQVLLRATFGINYLDFLETLEFIAERRLRCCDNGNDAANADTSSRLLFFDRFTPNDFHIRTDLRSIQTVLENMLLDPLVNENRVMLHRRCLRLLAAIEKAL